MREESGMGFQRMYRKPANGSLPKKLAKVKIVKFE